MQKGCDRTARRAASPRWRPGGHVYDVCRVSMWRLCVRALCLSCTRLDAVPFGPWLSVWGYGKTKFSFRVSTRNGGRPRAAPRRGPA